MPWHFILNVNINFLKTIILKPTVTSQYWQFVICLKFYCILLNFRRYISLEKSNYKIGYPGSLLATLQWVSCVSLQRPEYPEVISPRYHLLHLPITTHLLVPSGLGVVRYSMLLVPGVLHISSGLLKPCAYFVKSLFIKLFFSSLVILSFLPESWLRNPRIKHSVIF